MEKEDWVPSGTQAYGTYNILNEFSLPPLMSNISSLSSQLSDWPGIKRWTQKRRKWCPRWAQYPTVAALGAIRASG